jgi:hypothetical protein
MLLMSEPARELIPIDVDDRGRTSLMRLHPRAGHYLGEVQHDGTVVLHPATMVLDAQQRLDGRADIQAAIEQLRSHPETAIRRGRPSRRPAL